MCEKRVVEGAGCGSEDDNLVMNGDIILILFVFLDNIVYLCNNKTNIDQSCGHIVFLYQLLIIIIINSKFRLEYEKVSTFRSFCTHVCLDGDSIHTSKSSNC